jgi:hypothetical protein
MAMVERGGCRHDLKMWRGVEELRKVAMKS